MSLSKQIPFLKNISKEKRTISDPVSFLPMEVIVSDPTLNKDNTDIEISSVSGKGFWMFGINSLLEENTQVRNHFRYLNLCFDTIPNKV